MDDTGLLRRKRGDEAAFAELFQRHRTAVYRYAVHMAGYNGGSPDDIVQEVFMAFLRQLARYDAARGTVQAYLLGIARRQIFKQIGAWRDGDAIDEAVPSVQDTAFDDLSRAETVARVRAAVGALPPAFREAIVLCELNELDYIAAAAVMKCPIGTVRSRLHRGRAMLAKALAASLDAPKRTVKSLG